MPHSSPKHSFAEAIQLAIKHEMTEDETVLVYGLGVNDPKRTFGTTAELLEKFGSKRIFETPTSENAMLGVGVGLAVSGFKPVHVHQRMDFFLLAMDQLVNSAVKWRFMFGGVYQVPLTIRLIVGRGWGQGPTHSQNFSSWFAHLPGLKVVIPATVEEAYGLMRASIQDPNPVIFIEHRWLHGQIGTISKYQRMEIGRYNVARIGDDVTIVGSGQMIPEALRAASLLERCGIDVEIVSLSSIRPIDYESIFRSVKKTGRLLLLENEPLIGSFSSEIGFTVYSNLGTSLVTTIVRLGPPDYPEPTAHSLTKNYHVGTSEILNAIGKIMAVEIPPILGGPPVDHDVPGPWFKGPF
jgi:acetoin:2,6-dichlorophenolindophenol oxidoreductase subunit beta